ncbi:MAG: hypothetical protein EAZ07_02960 [Cytophagales bacterium]|nr:MAG: hypothetical protein EAZ07_02960 [Cytophagales bacterium]
MRFQKKTTWILVFLNLTFISTLCLAQSANKSELSSDEEVSKYRLKYNTSIEENGDIDNNSKQDFIPTLDVTKQLNQKLDSIALKNKKFKYAQGYRILVYTGSSSEEVNKIKAKVIEIVGSEPVYSVYKQPTFRIKVGDYLNRVDAGRVIMLLKTDFPNAILIPDQIIIIKDKSSEQK